MKLLQRKFVVQKGFILTVIVERKKIFSTGALIKRCSEDMQEIYRRTPMSKYHFSKVAKQLY